MANVNVEKITDTLGDAMKLAANLSEASKKDSKSQSNIDTNTQTNPNQQVQIHIGDTDDGKKKPDKPVIIREKPETHIHKDFPDNRSLTDKECDLALEKAKMENEMKIRQMQYQQYKFDLDRKDRLDREERERKEREEQRIKNEKRNKIGGIIAGIMAALCAAGAGYAVFSNNRNQRPGEIPSSTSIPISGQSSVE